MRRRAGEYGAAALIVMASLAQAIAQTEPNSNAPQTAAKTAPARPADDPGTCDRYLPANFALPPAAATTLVSLHINPAGDVSNVAITRSSGYGDLEKAA